MPEAKRIEEDTQNNQWRLTDDDGWTIDIILPWAVETEEQAIEKIPGLRAEEV